MYYRHLAGLAPCIVAVAAAAVVNSAGWQYLTFHNIYLAIYQKYLGSI